MNVCIFLAIGESWEDFVAKGQDKLWLRDNLSAYSRAFTRVYIFSYGKKGGRLLPNVFLLPNKWGIHRFLYAIMLPFFYTEILSKATLYRGYQLTSCLPGLVSKLLYKKPLIINYGYDYSLVAKTEGKKVHAILLSLIERKLLPFVDYTICTTKTLAGRISLFTPKHVLIPNGIDTQIFAPKSTQKAIDILFVGRLEPQKNLFLLLGAIDNLSTRDQKISAVFIGDGSLKEKLLMESKRLELQVSYLPAMPQTKLVDYYQESRILVLPSAVEGHPKVLLEAMSCELAVIGTNVTGIREVITHKKTGLLVEPNTDQLAHAIHTLLRDRKLRLRLGKQARQVVLTKYNKIDTWKKEIEILTKIAT